MLPACSGFNPVGYDIANHWCEYGGDYDSDQPHWMDFSLLPDALMQRIFLRAYVNAVLALQQHMSSTVRLTKVGCMAAENSNLLHWLAGQQRLPSMAC